MSASKNSGEILFVDAFDMERIGEFRSGRIRYWLEVYGTPFSSYCLVTGLYEGRPTRRGRCGRRRRRCVNGG